MNRTIPLSHVDHKLLDEGVEISTVTKVTLPAVEVTTTTINASGMLGPMDVPNTNQLGAMTYAFEYSGNSPEAERLHRPGTHSQELRLVEDVFDRVEQKNRLQGVKYRFRGMHTSTSLGDAEKGAAATNSVTYQCIRYEKYVEGELKILVDKIAGIYQVDGVDYAADVRAMLD